MKNFFCQSYNCRTSAVRPRSVACLLFITSFIICLNGTAKCDEADRPAWARDLKPRLNDSEKARPSLGTEDAAADVDARSAKVFALIQIRDIHGAAKEQQELVKLLENSRGISDWQTKMGRDYYHELDRVCSLGGQEQQIYLDACEERSKGREAMSWGRIQVAEEHLLKALRGYRSVSEEGSLPVTVSLEILGQVYLLAEESNKAKDCFLRALHARKASLGAEHPTYSDVLYLLASACRQLEDLDQSEAYLREAIVRDRRTAGTMNLRYAKLLGSLSEILLTKGQLLEAEAVCLQAISIAEKAQDPEVSRLASHSSILVEVHLGFEEYEAAEVHLKRAMEWYARHPSYANARLLEIQKFLAALPTKDYQGNGGRPLEQSTVAGQSGESGEPKAIERR